MWVHRKTFGWQNNHTMFCKTGKKQFKMMYMFPFRRTSTEKVVNVSEDKIRSSKDFMNKSLEGLCTIATEGHANKFIKTKRSDNGSLGYITRLYRTWVIGMDKINFGEYLLAIKKRTEIWKVGNWIPIRNGGIVERMIITIGGDQQIS